MILEKQSSGKAFINFLGKNIFRSDLCIGDAELGDLLIHEVIQKNLQLKFLMLIKYILY